MDVFLLLTHGQGRQTQELSPEAIDFLKMGCLARARCAPLLVGLPSPPTSP